MLLTKEVEVNLNSSNISHYESLGYKIPRVKIKNSNKYRVKKGTKIIVKVKDLSLYSKVKVELQCEYCGKIYSSTYQDYCTNNIKGNIHKDACIKCSHLKSAEANILLYGVSNSLKRPEIKEKCKNTFLERYNQEYFIRTESFNKKSEETFIKKFGVNHPSKNKDIKDKIRNAQNFKIDFIREEFANKGYILLTKIYINNSQQLEYICLKHINKGIQITTYNKLSGAEDVCVYCVGEKISERLRHEYNFVKSVFEAKNLELLEPTYINEQQSLRYKCNNHPNIIQKVTFNALYCQNQSCPICALENRSGENHYNWKGGISPIENFLRTRIVQWKKDSMRNCNYKCIITGEKFDNIHHLYSFNIIVKEVFSELCLEIKNNINEYSQDELDLILDKCLELHCKYGLGVCLSRNVHDLYHHLYGHGDNTPEQFEEFVDRYYNGEFNVDNAS